MIYGDAVVGPDLDSDTTAAVLRAVKGSLTAGPCPEFGSPEWAGLPVDDPRRAHACVRAALAWWSATVFGPGVPADVLDREFARRMAGASRDVHRAAGPGLWSRLARDRAFGVPVQRARSEYAAAELFERAGQGGAA